MATQPYMVLNRVKDISPAADGPTIEGDRQKARIRVALEASGRPFLPHLYYCSTTTMSFGRPVLPMRIYISKFITMNNVHL
jgi:hypothetical protein